MILPRSSPTHRVHRDDAYPAKELALPASRHRLSQEISLDNAIPRLALMAVLRRCGAHNPRR
jgi:hypothetical protein